MDRKKFEEYKRRWLSENCLEDSLSVKEMWEICEAAFKDKIDLMLDEDRIIKVLSENAGPLILDVDESPVIVIGKSKFKKVARDLLEASEETIENLTQEQIEESVVYLGNALEFLYKYGNEHPEEDIRCEYLTVKGILSEYMRRRKTNG